MEKKFSGKIWKFGNDIDTDTIIPGKRGTIPDRNEMKKYAFELLKPEFGSTVQPGDILVAGTNFGCGSSREQAATVLSYNGVRCIIAKSFARIFFRNAFNSGILLLTCDQIQDVCEGGDIVTVDVDAQTVSVNGKTFKVGAVPENLYNIVANGGLIEDTKKRLAAGNVKMDIKPLSMEQCRKKGYTMVEKILKKNAGKEHVAPGDIVITKPDMFMIHDIYTTYLLETMKDIGADKIDDPDKVTIVWDHCMPTAVAKNDYDHYEAGLELAKTYGIKKLHIGEGICHTIMHEAKYAKPGEIATATDSHTTTYGCVGAFSSGIGYTEMASILGTGTMWIKVPETIKVVVDGELPENVMSKDIILRLIGDLGADGATYRALEFTGSTVKNMTVASRMTMANMAIEAGAKCALFTPDEKTAEYCDITLNDYQKSLFGDPDAAYCRVMEYNAEDFVPVMACPSQVDKIRNVSELEGTEIDQVFIGSCTNGRLEDLAAAAEVLKGRQVAKFVKLIVTPASRKIYRQADEMGILDTLAEAGAIITHPGCGLCCGRTGGILTDGERVVATNNRNFLGRMGTSKVQIYLASPKTAASCAIAGKIVSPQ